MTNTPLPGTHISIREALRNGARSLSAVADNPRLEARLLLAHALDLSTADIIANPDRMIDPARFADLLNRRMTHAPIAYLLGHRDFWSLDLLVSTATLIPRPDTETVVEAALAVAPDPASVLDLGTGSGCLLLAVLHDRPNAVGIGIDRSFDAVVMARANAQRCGISRRAFFLQGDWAGAIRGQFDLVVSNPPYIPHCDIPSLMPDVRLHEPLTALDGGTDGLDAYRCLIPALAGLLTRAGHAVLEVGVGQAAAVAALGHAHGLHPAIRSDLAGIERAVILARSPM